MLQEEHLWNYAPDGGDSCSGTTQPFQAAALPFVQKTNATIGSTYLKARLQCDYGQLALACLYIGALLLFCQACGMPVAAIGW